MNEHENSIDIDGLCCTECFYQGRIAERERIIEVIRDWYEADADLIEGPGNLIDWIQSGENE